MKFGYIRVSTKDQNFDIQLKALLEAGVSEENIYKEKISGKSMDRIELPKLLEILRKDDELVVYDLSRLGRNAKNVYELLDDFNKKGINFISLKENLNLDTPMGRFMATMISAINQLDLDIRNEKTREGLQRVKEKGQKLGRKPLDEKTLKEAFRLYDEGYTIPLIVKATGISRASLYNKLNEKNKANRKK